MLSFTGKTALVALPVAIWALMINVGNQPTAIPCLQVIPSPIDPGTRGRDRSLLLRNDHSFQVRTLNADNSLSFDHLQRELPIIPSAPRSEELLPIMGTVCQDSLFFLYSGAKKLPYEFLDLLHRVCVHTAVDGQHLNSAAPGRWATN